MSSFSKLTKLKKVSFISFTDTFSFACSFVCAFGFVFVWERVSLLCRSGSLWTCYIDPSVFTWKHRESAASAFRELELSLPPCLFLIFINTVLYCRSFYKVELSWQVWWPLSGYIWLFSNRPLTFTVFCFKITQSLL